MSRLAVAPSHSGLMDIDRVTNAIFERKERDVLKVSQLMVIATLAIIGTPLLFDAAAAADEFSFELSTNAPVTAQGYSNTDSFGGDGTFVNSDMIGSPDKKTTCPVPPQKKKSPSKPAPKPEAAATGGPSITQVCSPSITINMPQGKYFHPSQSFTTDSILGAQPLFTIAKPLTNPATPNEPAKAPESFKLKFKNLFETEFTTHSPLKMGIFMLICLLATAASLYFFYIGTKRSSKSRALALIGGFALLMLAGFLAYLVMMKPAPQKIEDSTIDSVYTELMAAQAASTQQPGSNLSDIEQHSATPQTELTQAQAQRPATLDNIGEPKKSEITQTEWRLISNILFVGSFIFCLLIFSYSCITGISLFARKPFSRDLPLDDIYNLEEEISKTIAATNNWLENSEVQLNSLLNSINYARKLLESSGASRGPSPIRSATFFVRADQTDYSSLNDSLRKLDDFLSTRPKYPRYKWRAKVFEQLTSTRQDILKVCNVRPYGEESNVK